MANPQQIMKQAGWLSSASQVALVTVAVVLIAGCSGQESSSTPVSVVEQTVPEQEQEPTPIPEFDRAAHSIDDPSSIWVVSNKLRPLKPADVVPEQLVIPEGVENMFAQPLRAEAATAVQQFVQAAAIEGHQVRITSAYRDYGTQVSLYERYVARDGQAAADTYSARPGHSEHQTGLAVDLHGLSDECYLASCFGEMPVGVWLAEHAAEFGFVIRYPEGAESITGFVYEPWHFRYVGVELAEEMRATETATLEEFFELAPAPGYAS